MQALRCSSPSGHKLPPAAWDSRHELPLAGWVPRVPTGTSHPCLQLPAPAGHLEVQRRELPPSLGRLKLPLRLPVVPALTICCDPSRGQACLTDGGAARSFFFRLRLARGSRERLHLRLRTRSCCGFHRLAGLRVEPVFELLLEPWQTGPSMRPRQRAPRRARKVNAMPAPPLPPFRFQTASLRLRHYKISRRPPTLHRRTDQTQAAAELPSLRRSPSPQSTSAAA